MKKLSEYNIDLKNMRQDSCEYEYVLDDRFFADIDAPEIHKGNLKVLLSVKKSIGAFLLEFHVEGTVTAVCDRCLDDLELPVETDNALKVKLGAEFAETDDFITIPEEEGHINVAWFIYEFVALSLPMKKVHAPGECNEKMMGVLNEHSCTSSPEADEENPEAETDSDENRDIDPRWSELKKILNNN